MQKNGFVERCIFFYCVAVFGIITTKNVEGVPNTSSTKKEAKWCAEKYPKTSRNGALSKASRYSGIYVGTGPLFRSIKGKINISDNWKEVAERHGNYDQQNRHLKIFLTRSVILPGGL